MPVGHLQCLFQIGYCLGILPRTYQKIGIDGRIPSLLLRRKGIFLRNFKQSVFGLVKPAQFEITTGRPYPGIGHQSRVPREMAGNIYEGCQRSQKIALIKLRLSHQHPCVMNERIEFSSLDIFPIFGITHFFSIAFRRLLYGMLPYRLLAFFQSPGKIAFRLRVGRDSVSRDRVHVQQMCKIIFITVLHRIELFFKTRYTIEIDIITSRKRMKKAGRTRILLRRTRRQ